MSGNSYGKGFMQRGPGGAPLYQVWWKSTQGFLRFRVNEVKIAYLDQIHWPLTLDVGRISPKI